MYSSLPTECLREIFEHAYEYDDLETLGSCLLVNRKWCEAVIPVMWRNPWVLSWFNWREKSTRSITSTIYALLPHEIKIAFIVNGITITPPTTRIPLFNYVQYIQVLEYRHIKGLIHGVFNHELYNSLNTNHNLMYIERLLYNFFLINSNIKYFEIPRFPLLGITAPKNCFSGLREITCDADISPQIFKDLEKVCTSLEKLIINKAIVDNEGLASFIHFQKRLQYISMCDNVNDEADSRKVGKSLHEISLLYIHFRGQIFFSPKILAKFSNLKLLNLELSAEKPIMLHESSNFPVLEFLEVIYDRFTPYKVFTCIIKRTKGMLRRIAMNVIEEPQSEKEAKDYVLAIADHCPKIEFVTIWYKEGIYDALEEMFKKCQRLEGIKLITVEDIKTLPLLEFLAIKSPKSLKMINLSSIGEFFHGNMGWGFSPLDLTKFFEMWKGRELLNFYISDVKGNLTRECVKTLQKYLRHDKVLNSWEEIQMLEDSEDIINVWETCELWMTAEYRA
ncbi:206_t:CDS:1 [Funneliformis geosporum]|uniref:7691_t:CDS:1 n=1 Tax=Funneliformis geosporum TaxID=1117311 RepID=A0A9W4SEK6_9GLOM|nr:206_t:CDS:1 [Funneliformis geosporum]CAI2165495.1 7691_t:CDS:1 [Funneliformis geosporum]